MSEKLNITAMERPKLSILFALLALLLAGLLAFPMRSQAAGTIVYVDTSASGIGDGSSWADAYPSLADALAGAASDTEIWVASGTYKPTTTASDPRTATFQLKNGVAVYGGFAGGETQRDQRDWQTNVTLLSGDLNGDDSGALSLSNSTLVDNSYSVVTGATGATLDGVTITSGYAIKSGFTKFGGGMYNDNSSPTLANVTFTGNAANYGGGMFNTNGSNPTLTNVTFTGNASIGFGCCGGGGMANISSSPTLTSVTFSGNTSNRFGGGMYGASASPVLTHVTFDGNSAVFEGGGLYSTGPTNLTLTDVTFSGNSATYGGGMYSDHSDLTTTLTNVIFSGNSATNGGGLMMISNTNVLLTNVIFSGNSATYGGGMFTFTDNNATLANVIFSGNSATDGGGLLTTGSNNLTLTNATISGNSALRYGGGMLSQNGSNPQIRNSILWNNGSSGVYIGNDLGQPASVPVFSSSIVQGAGGSAAWNPTFGDAGYPYNTSYAIDGGGNLDADPLFVSSSDLHLSPGSPTINTGDNSFLPVGVTTDLDGNPRIVGGTVDMGAYEAVVNTPPTIAANQSSVTVAEGQTATNGGTVADADGNSVTLAASVGSVTNNGNGTWSWSYATNDGPAQSQPVTITADDGNGGTASANFTLTVNNVSPTVTTVTGPANPQAIGSAVIVSGAFTDPGTVDTHTATWNWGDGSAATSGTVTEADGSGTVSGSHAYTAAGVYTVNLTVTDKDGGVGMNIFQYIVVYDASTGHVTGGGWINSPAGAYPADPTLTDTATFGFVAKYQKGNPVPTGNTEFKFQLGNFNFKSTSYQWLIVNQNGTNAQFKGTGSINGSGDYTFMIWATDGNPDTFRIQITDSNGTTVYDNGTQQAIGGGSIVIHK